ncbi:YdgA family protein [Psychrosphaera sp.]|nr:YdgA family protein [Psychrosphaera sp.]
MSNLKKGLSVVAVAAIGAAVLGPKVVGSQLESTLKTQVAKLNESAGYNAEIMAFESSWFSTSAKVSLTLDLETSTGNTPSDDQDALESIHSIIDVSAQHGPLLFNDIATLGWLSLTASVDGKSISDHFITDNKQALYTLQNHMTLLGSHSFQDNIAPLVFDCTSCEQPIKITYDGYQGAGEVSSNNMVYKGVGRNTLFNMPNGELKLGELSIDFAGEVPLEKLFSMGLYNSSGSLALNNVTYTKVGTPNSVEFKGIGITTETKLNSAKKLANMVVGYELESFTDGDIEGKDFDIEFEFTNIDNNFLNEYETFLNQVAEAESEQSELERIQSEFMNTHVLALVKANPHMNLTKFNGTLTQGSFTGNVNSELVNIEAMPEMIADPKFWLTHTQADGKFLVDKPLASYFAKMMIASQIRKNPQAQGMPEAQIQEIASAQSGTFLNSLIQQGMIVELESQFESKISLKDLQLLVNDQQIPLPY